MGGSLTHWNIEELSGGRRLHLGLRRSIMRVAVIVVFVSVLTTASEASKSCMSKTEARQHFGSVWIYWHGKDHCWDATTTGRHIRSVTFSGKLISPSGETRCRNCWLMPNLCRQPHQCRPHHGPIAG